jgi:hypothetical protein
MEAIGFALARTPDMFPRVAGTDLSAITVKLYNDTPSVRFLYVYDDERVTLVAIDFA